MPHQHEHGHDHHHHDGHGQKDKDHHKEVTIIVNGREKTVTDRTWTFDELVHLAFENPPTGEFICFTITYRRAAGHKPQGILEEDGVLKVKEGTIINVVVTDKS